MLETLKTPGDTSWFTHDRFGLFIHWGLYAMPSKHEWLRSINQINNEDYEKYFKYFDPDLYDPRQWAQAAADAGMKYFVITTKHHEGFCLWDTKQTDYKATNTPAGRDLLRPMIEAFREKGIRVGLYHSLLDWHHPQYVIDAQNHPLRNHPDRLKLNAQRDQQKYADYLHAQTQELLSQYGPIDILWYDFSFPSDDGTGKGHRDWRSPELVKLIRKLQPKVILNDRLDLPAEPPTWDVKTPEQLQPRTWPRVDGKPVVWEACQTFSTHNGSWGYHRDDQSWRSVEQLVQTLIDCVSKGGNLLLNVGPTARGEFDARSLDRLAGIGRWMKYHNRSIYGCTQAPSEFITPQDCRLTYNPERKRLYIHLFVWPYKHIHLEGNAFAERLAYAQLLNDGSEIAMGVDAWQQKHLEGREKLITLNMPQVKPDVAVPVIELILK